MTLHFLGASVQYISLLFSVFIVSIGAASASETVTHSYDPLGRLVGVTRSGSVNNGVSSSYSLDASGNRSSVFVGGSPNGLPVYTCQHSIGDTSVTAGGVATFTVSRSGSNCYSNVEVDYYTQNGTAVAGTHYTSKSGTLEFQNPSQLSKTVTVNTTASSTSEPRQFSVKIEVNNAPSHEGAIDDIGAATINPAFCHYQISDASVTAGGIATFTVTRSGNSCVAAVEVFYQTGNGSAASGTHYTSKSGTLEFQNPSQLTKTITVNTTAGSTTVPRQFMVNIEGDGRPGQIVTDGTGMGTINP